MPEGSRSPPWWLWCGHLTTSLTMNFSTEVLSLNSLRPLTCRRSDRVGPCLTLG
jgi:hypothetical protein